MSRYFKRLAQRTGLFNAGAGTKQFSPAAPNRKINDIQESSATTVAVSENTPEQPRRELRKSISIETEANQSNLVNGNRSVNVPNFKQAPMTLTRSQIDKSGQHSLTNGTVEHQSVEQSDSGLKRQNSKYSEKTRQAMNSNSFEHTDAISNNPLDAEDLTFGSPIVSGADPDVSAGVGLTENTTPQQFETPMSGTPRRRYLGEVLEGKINNALTSIPQQHVSQNDVATDPRHILASKFTGVPYPYPQAAPVKLPLNAGRQKVEISIGSVTMEVHQKQPLVVTAASQPRLAVDTRSRNTGKSSGFSLGRHYLRGL